MHDTTVALMRRRDEECVSGSQSSLRMELGSKKNGQGVEDTGVTAKDLKGLRFCFI